MRRIFLANDHVSIELKKAVLEYLSTLGIDAVDLGTNEPDLIVDYPDYAQKVALSVAAGECDGGIVICGTGIGASIAANKVRGVRAALCHDTYTAHQARAHNDANVLAMGAWIVSPERMKGIVSEWLNTPFEGGRHTARLRKLERYIPDGDPEKTGAKDPNVFQYSMSLSIRQTVFGPVLFSGRLEEGFRTLQQEGFHQVELSIRNIEDQSFKELKDRLDRYGLTVSALATGQGCLHDQLCLSTMDPDKHRRALERMTAIIDVAGQLGCPVVLGGVRGRLTGSETEQADQRKIFLEGLNECDRQAGDHGTHLILEPINRYETNLVNTTEEALELLVNAGTSHTQLLLDTFHMNIEEADPALAIRMAGPHLGYLHIADSNRRAPGLGHLDFRPIFQALDAIGYRGMIAAEILPLPSDANAVRLTGDYLRSIGVHLDH